ncbi:MAG TPA: galactokinase [Candidatus Acidoferrales bacterium]|nr:galactokinase [Candidatus Acidoferrales bacterium]
MTAIRARAPGRVNLIGEHTDYNDGFVMPVAIALGTEIVSLPRDDRTLVVDSAAYPQPASFDLDGIPRARRNDWADYARGVILELQSAGVALRPANLRVTSDLPRGAGLSSSASFEVALALALLQGARARMEPREIALLCRRAETTGAGVRSGIMDQFAALFCRAGHALLLDTRSLDYEQLPFPHGVAVVVCNTMTRRSLAAGAYNTRREECERAVRRLRERNAGVRALRDVTPAGLEARRDDLGEPIYRRARHVVGENARVLEARRALQRGDARRLGALMNASHESLRDDYDVSSRELDAMVDAARACEGVYGARMTGAGFGGCTVNLVAADDVDAFRRNVSERYRAITGIVPEIYDGTPSDGAR